MITILDAVRDTKLFQPWFKRHASWDNWLIFLAALFALPMTPQQLAVYQQCTGRELPPITAFKEVWLAIGRRGGKSRMLALVAVYLACFFEYRRYLAPGERGTIVIIAQDRKAARTIFRFVKGLLTGVPMLKRMIERETADTFDLTNSISIEIQAASFRSNRGYTLVAALCDEIAFWRNDESANPDKEILAAIRPAMATIPNAMLLCASSPYARRGALWDAHRRHFGKDSPVLVWKAPTRTMNPSVPQSIVDAAYEADSASAAAEYGAEFRTDVETFISREVVDAAVVLGRYELPRIEGVAYVAFCDPSGGSSDSMTLGIAHMEGERAILDLARERKPPFSPESVVKEFADTIKSYGISTVRGDRYAGLWPRERFAVHGVDYQVASQTKSDIYLALLPMLNSGRVELLDHPRLTSQLCGLERRTARGGKDSVDHAPGAHDDVINAAAGALVVAAQRDAQRVPLVAPIILSQTQPPVPGSTTLSTTQAFYEYTANGGGNRFGGT
ncbi:hypothetical protein SAMN05443247_06523 [Bradyrhizobium erythrophlei]|nr:hypothetical protein SAMN05443247_06523 [Bradyrhizobium erythrophlei]